MKKVSAIILILMILTCTLFVGCSDINSDDLNNEEDALVCHVDGCNEPRKLMLGYDALSLFYSDYCIDHTCLAESCILQRDENERYCAYHKQLDFVLTDSQIEEGRKMAYEYCDKLVSEYPEISAVNIVNDIPKKSIVGMHFTCILEINGSMKGAEICLEVSKDDGEIKIIGLVYNDDERSWWY